MYYANLLFMKQFIILIIIKGEFEMNLPLKIAIVESQKPAYEIAAKLGITETRLSRIIFGRLKPREDEIKKLSELLNRNVSELFPENKKTVA